jgi:hypothetical protein
MYEPSEAQSFWSPIRGLVSHRCALFWTVYPKHDAMTRRLFGINKILVWNYFTYVPPLPFSSSPPYTLSSLPYPIFIMSGPGGHNGSGQHKAGFDGLVQKAIGKKQQEGSSVALDQDSGPSKALPSTGLKKNTQEWKDAEREKERKRRKGRKREGSVSSSSSIPSGATAGSDDETTEQREGGQEGPLGRGPGGHEREIKENGGGGGERGYGGDLVESPVNEKRKVFPNGVNSAPKSNGHTQTRHDGSTEEDDDDHGEGEDGFDPEERIIRRDSHRARKLTDESGKFPDGLPGVKDEEPPGPRNEIVLDPRISYMHVSYFISLQMYLQLILCSTINRLR